MATYTIDMSACCCQVNCTDYPLHLYGTLDGPSCAVACSVLSYPQEMYDPTNSNSCYWEFTAGGGNAGLYCPNDNGAGFSVQVNADGTVTISNPGGYCGPPTVTITPVSLHPLLVVYTYDSSEGTNCCGEGEGGSVTLTITE